MFMLIHLSTRNTENGLLSVTTQIAIIMYSVILELYIIPHLALSRHCVCLRCWLTFNITRVFLLISLNVTRRITTSSVADCVSRLRSVEKPSYVALTTSDHVKNHNCFLWLPSSHHTGKVYPSLI